MSRLSLNVSTPSPPKANPNNLKLITNQMWNRISVLIGFCVSVVHPLSLGNHQHSVASRRAFVSNTVAFSLIVGTSLPSQAIYPSVTVAQFQTILKDSGTFLFVLESISNRIFSFKLIFFMYWLSVIYSHPIASSVKIVEFSGPQAETATVTLVDGTTFEISDLFESSTDPRSPLRLVATCRSYGVTTKFSELESVIAELSKTGKRKVYMNKRVQEALEKEKEKKERMAQDEVERNMQLLQIK